MTEIRLCGRCKKSISQTDLESGLTTERYGQLICQECTSQLSRKKEKGFDELSFFYESILNEVKSIRRVLTYETGSWLHIIAAVAQCFVFGSLIFAYINRRGDLHSTLLLAIVFQLMALTFFVIKK
ncbi:MAG: hypothetical protein D8M57_01355 [Candidatus Scalindua sp. AMX11]|nr:MAG: hypothetical protein DWQ00_15335 [Candidatus Scalindua sp.]NOG85036.1 hypothetical protein [Planctomycetota bacterium]RZV93087.1 MAG: hypothetical protein EX341_04270 [Candidatus Scalindua sp. SCAELEC01]TDE66713.1 MAG: hypothetical protein D8M57_01355 [Candidatus Scalindua sp. AMX11]GJQ58020.1 MAG: hypothetical protein SCALA701_08210 [Candidatus Scalindua sp.]